MIYAGRKPGTNGLMIKDIAHNSFLLPAATPLLLMS